MRVTLKYDHRWFGNESAQTKYGVTLQYASAERIEIAISFDQGTPGRGANLDNAGVVQGATIELSKDHARKIATALLWHLEVMDKEMGQAMKLTFSEA